ncbi:pheromone processing endoprotease [Mortierella antarctica]|nr:pheromone processing endoprotease [Mortierella antarctica]
MKPVLLLFSALAILAATSSPVAQAAKRPHFQDTSNHHYYAVKLNDLVAASPLEIAQHLGVQYVGQVGELPQYHLFSYAKTIHEKRSEASPQYSSSSNATFTDDGQHQDIVLRRYEQLRQSNVFPRRAQGMKGGLRKRDFDNDGVQETDATLHPLGGIHKQVRQKRFKRDIPLLARDEYVQGDNQPSDGIAAHFQIKDPGFGYQWHLHNTLQPGNDINVTGVWDQNITGKGAIVAIIDDGLDANSEDLAPNFFANGSHDFNDNVDIPLPRKWDDNHGTRCAGEIASSRNNLCGVGVAWDAKVAGLRILSGDITDVQEAEALNYNFQETQIFSCSWGPPDDGIAMAGPNELLLDAFINGVDNGRQGKGSIFVFATGNGGRDGDNCNFDGYTNSRYTVSIGAISRTNKHPIYSEACSAQMAVTYSSGDGSYIYTCDTGKRNCYQYHSGTSAAAPIAAAIYALVLEVRPDLNWRDIQYLTAHTAVPIDENDPDWEETSVGRLFNHKYGYGKLDAYRIVEYAKTWTSVGARVTYESPVITVNGEIPSGIDDMTGQTGVVGLPSTFVVTEAALKDAKFGILEHVTVTVNIQHAFRGDVEVELRSPDNIISQLAAHRPRDNTTEGFVDWTFMSVKHWEESPIGTWTLTVFDRHQPDKTGTFINWKLGLHGEVAGGRNSTPPPPPPPPPRPTTAPAIPEKTPMANDPINEDDGRSAIKISPFIYVMFAGMFVAIGAALFLMYRQRTNPKSMFGARRDDEEAAQRGGLLGRRGDYEFDELPTHELGGSDDSDDDDDDSADPDSRRILFDRSKLGTTERDESGVNELKTGAQRELPSPLSSVEEIEPESSFEVAVADEDGDDEDEDDDDDDFEDYPGGSGSKIKSDSWDEFSTLVKAKDGKRQ